MLIGLLVVVKIANYYGPAEYGMYQYALSINTLLGIILLFVDSRVVKKQYKPENSGHIIFNTTLVKVILSIFLLFISAIIIFTLGESVEFNRIFLLLLCNNILLNLGFGIQNYFEYELQSKKIVIAGNIALTIGAVLQLLAIWIGYPLTAIVIILLISSFIKLIILYLQYKTSYNIPVDFKIDLPLITSLIKESIPLAIAGAAATVYTRIDQVMIGSMLSLADVGKYALSTKLVGVIAIAIGPIQVSVFPKMIEDFAKKDHKEYIHRYKAITSLMTWTYIAGTILVFLLSPWIFKTFFSKAYAESLPVFQIQIFGTFFLYNAILRSSHLTLNGKTHIMMITQIIAVFINILLNYIFISYFGIYGAAYATVVTQFLSLSLLNLFFPAGREVVYLQLQGLNPFNILLFNKK